MVPRRVEPFRGTPGQRPLSDGRVSDEAPGVLDVRLLLVQLRGLNRADGATRMTDRPALATTCPPLSVRDGAAGKHAGDSGRCVGGPGLGRRDDAPGTGPSLASRTRDRALTRTDRADDATRNPGILGPGLDRVVTMDETMAPRPSPSLVRQPNPGPGSAPAPALADLGTRRPRNGAA